MEAPSNLRATSLDVDVPKAGVRRVDVGPLSFGSGSETRTRTAPWDEEAP